MDAANDRPSLDINERVVWLSDTGPEYGNIRWLGKLPDIGHEWMAGVEFDNPVGSGTGLYKDQQLFFTRLNHASLVPIIGLIKASDFDEPPPQPPQRTVFPNLIDYEPELPGYESPLRSSLTKDAFYKYNQFDAPYNPSNNSITGGTNYCRTVSPQNQKQPGRVFNVPISFEKPDNNDGHSNWKKNATQVDQQYTSKYPSSQEAATKISQSNLRFSPSNVQTQQASKKSIIDKNDVHKLTSTLARTNIQHPPPSAHLDIPILPGPSLILTANDKNNINKDFLGKSRGIQGNNNSCYLDATLFAMFSATTLFDSMLYRPPNRNDIPGYSEIQRILREDIVRPLRENHFVSADQVMNFRTMLEKSSTVAGLTDEEKDPEEFLSLLLGQILKAEPYLKLSTGLESFFYQLIVDKDENMVLPSVQDLFEQSFINSTIRLREIPPCLLIQMPRFGRQYKMYSRIKPSLRLDITDVLEAVPRSCGHRGKDCDNIARYECNACFGERLGRTNTRLSSITFCHNCFKAKHFSKSHTTGIEDHESSKTVLDKIHQDAVSRYSFNSKGGLKGKEIPRIQLDLFAVLCIETSHYVCFVKCGPEANAGWCFFDSMADRRGEQNGYNIPEVLLFDDLAFWTSDKGVAYLLNHKDDKLIPEMARRLICDSYLCFYQYPDLLTYR